MQTPTSALSRSKCDLFQVQYKRTLCSSLSRSKSISRDFRCNGKTCATRFETWDKFHQRHSSPGLYQREWHHGGDVGWHRVNVLSHKWDLSAFGPFSTGLLYQADRICSEGLRVEVSGECEVSARIGNREYPNVTMCVMDGLRTDVILRRDFMAQHSSVNFNFGVSQPLLNLGTLEALKTLSEPRLFDFLKEDCQPIVTKPRRYSNEDRTFIAQKGRELLQDGLIQRSNYPRRAQSHVITKESIKKASLHRL